MRALMLEADERMLAERRRLRLDHRDEMWEGCSTWSLRRPKATSLEAELLVALAPVVRALGWRMAPETGVFGADDDYRVPDLVVHAPGAASERGLDGAPELVVEIRSPGDESEAKIHWYLARGAGAVLVIDRDTLAVDLYAGAGRQEPAAGGTPEPCHNFMKSRSKPLEGRIRPSTETS